MMYARRRPQGASQLASDHGLRPRWPVLGEMAGVSLLVMLLGWGLAWLWEPASLPVNVVRIDSRLQQVEHESIRQLVLPYAQAGFLRLDVEAVRNELEGLPWVSRAGVRRAWPDVLVVSIEEHVAVARWAGGGLLSSSGERFEPEATDGWQHLALLRGPEGSEMAVLQEYVRMQEMLRPLALAISHLGMDERRAWSMQLGNTLHVGLGRQEIDRRLLRFIRVYPGVVEPRLEGIESVDMRYTNGFAVHWRAGYQPAAV